MYIFTVVDIIRSAVGIIINVATDTYANVTEFLIMPITLEWKVQSVDSAYIYNAVLIAQ